MNKATLITLLKKGEKDHLAETESSVWNLFVQILLPLILVLCFVAILDILMYKNAYVTTSEINQHLENELARLEHSNIGKEAKRTNIAIFNLQKQKLLKALEDVKHDEQIKLRVIKFMEYDDVPRVNADNVKLNGAEIADKDFKFLCTHIRDRMSSERQMQSYLENLYKKILDKADIRRDSFANVSSLHSQKETKVHREYIMSHENRTFIRQQITTFIHSLAAEVVELQSHVLIRIFDALMAEPNTLTDQQSQKLIGEILNLETKEDRRKKAVKEFYDQQVKQIKTKLKKEEYFFLEITWNKIESIQF